MFKFDHIDMQRIGVAAIGALVLTFTAVGAAVGPAVDNQPAAYAEAPAQEEARG